MTKQCAICGEPFEGWGNNPRPFAGDRCCDHCDDYLVTPVRALFPRSSQAERSVLRVLTQMAILGKLLARQREHAQT